MSIDRAAAIIATRQAARVERAGPVLPTFPSLCPDCFGAGIVVPHGSSVSHECPCGALLASHVARWAVESGLPRRHCHSGGFDAYKPASATHVKALASVRAYSDAWKPGGDGLVLAGTVGTGKTHLACAVAWRAMHTRTDSGFATVRFYNSPELLMQIRATYHHDSNEHESDIVDRAMSCDLLVLDDLGAEPGKDHAHQRLYLIINDRLEAGRTTIVTTNHDISKAIPGQQFDDRLLSRLHEIATPANTIHLTGKDHRRGPKQ